MPKEIKQNSTRADDKILSDLSYYIWENQSKIKSCIYKEIMKRLSSFSYYKEGYTK